MKKTISFLLFFACQTMASSLFAFAAGPEFDVIEKGYPDAIYYFAYNVGAAVTETVVVTDEAGAPVAGSVVVDPDDPSARSFVPDSPMALGPHEVTISEEGFGSLQATVDIVDRGENRSLTADVTPTWYEEMVERWCCEGECYEKNRVSAQFEIALNATAPLKIEARFQKDGKTSASQVWRVGGEVNGSLIATDGIEFEEACAVLIATDLGTGEMVDTIESCFGRDDFPEPPELIDEITDEIVSCAAEEAQEEREGDTTDTTGGKADAGCSSVGATRSSPFGFLLFAFCLLGALAPKRRH